MYNAAIILRHYQRLDANCDHIPQRFLADCIFTPHGPLGLAAARKPANLVGYNYEDFDDKPKPGPAAGPPKSKRSSQPAIWITVVGNDGFWPIRYRSIENASHRANEHADEKAAKTTRNAKTSNTRSEQTLPGERTAKIPDATSASQDPVPIRTHLDSTTRTLFVLVFGFAWFEIIQYLRGRAFWTNRIFRDPGDKTDADFRVLAWRNLTYRIAAVFAAVLFTWCLDGDSCRRRVASDVPTAAGVVPWCLRADLDGNVRGAVDT